jgi:hypothetical protein
VPAGNSDGGRWTDGGRGQSITGVGPGTRETIAAEAGSLGLFQIAPRDNSVNGVQLAGDTRAGLPVDLSEERTLGGHTIERHVGRSDASLLNAVNGTVSYARRNGDFSGGVRESSFPSLESANKLVNSTIARNRSMLDQVISGRLPKANLDAEFLSPTGREAYSRNERSQIVLSDTYGVRVIVVPDRTVSKGYRVDTAFPINLNRGR